MLEELGLIATYVTMGLTPIIYNVASAKKALKKVKKVDESKVEKEFVKIDGEKGSDSFTITIPCSITLLHSSSYGQAVHLTVKSLQPLPLANEERKFRKI